MKRRISAYGLGCFLAASMFSMQVAASPPQTGSTPQAAPSPSDSSSQRQASSGASTAVAVAPGQLTPSKTLFDLDLNVGYGRPLTDPVLWLPKSRLRVGALFARDPRLFMVGGTVAWTQDQPVALGMELEALHLETGLWGQLGGSMDLSAHPGVSLAVGWSLLGAEWQLRSWDDRGVASALFFNVRLPVGVILWGAQM